MCCSVSSLVAEPASGVTAPGSRLRGGPGRAEGECRSAGVVEALLLPAASGTAGSFGPRISRLRMPGRVCTFGTSFAEVATFCTGRRSSSETSATITGVVAALTSVPEPQSREAANDAAAEAMLAMISVCSVRRLPARWLLRSALRSGDSTASAYP